MRYLMWADLVMRVLLVEQQISDICPGCEVKYVEIVDVLWVILQQEHKIVVFEVIDLELLDRLLHVVIEFSLLLLVQRVSHLL